MDFRLTDAQRALIAPVREMAQTSFRQRALRWMDGSFPWDNIRDLASLGVLGMTVPEEYGGLGLPVFETALVLEEIAKGCYVTAMAVLGEVGTQTRIIATYAPDAVKQRLLPVDAREHHEGARLLGAADQRFLAVQNKLVAVHLDVRFVGRDVGAGMRLGHADRQDAVAADHRGQDAGADALRRVFGDDAGLHPRLAQHRHRRGVADLGDLLEHQRGLEDRQAEPAILLRHRHPEHAEAREVADVLPGEGAVHPA